MTGKFKTICALIASLAILTATAIGMLAAPASAASLCEGGCSFGFAQPGSVSSGPNELGLQFSTSVNGTIHGICFYEAAGETGSHHVTLWGPSGSVLATGTGTAIPGQDNCFGFNPVPVAANTTYTASYNNNTAFDYQVGQFAGGFGTNDLRAPVNAGVFSTPGVFPTITVGNSYGIDVQFFTGSDVVADCTSTLTAPGTPTAGPGPNSAAVSWAPATSSPAGCIAGYVVTPILAGVAQTPVTIPGQITTTVISGLTPGASYTFTVAAESGFTVGPASVATGAVTIGTFPAATSLTAVHVGKGAIQVAFKSAGSGARYTATCAAPHGATRSKSGTSSPIKVTGLTVGKAYSCSVKGINAYGAGPASVRTSAIKA
jgi:Domain of unknown function (DUF4082)/Fibronectin type III domain